MTSSTKPASPASSTSPSNSSRSPRSVSPEAQDSLAVKAKKVAEESLQSNQQAEPKSAKKIFGRTTTVLFKISLAVFSLLFVGAIFSTLAFCHVLHGALYLIFSNPLLASSCYTGAIRQIHQIRPYQ